MEKLHVAVDVHGKPIQATDTGAYVVVDQLGNFFAKTYSTFDAKRIAALPELETAARALLDWLIEAERELGVSLPVGSAARAQKPVVIEAIRAALVKGGGL